MDLDSRECILTEIVGTLKADRNRAFKAKDWARVKEIDRALKDAKGRLAMVAYKSVAA